MAVICGEEDKKKMFLNYSQGGILSQTSGNTPYTYGQQSTGMDWLVGCGISITGSFKKLLDKYLLGTAQAGLSAMVQRQEGSGH